MTRRHSNCRVRGSSLVVDETASDAHFVQSAGAEYRNVPVAREDDVVAKQNEIVESV
jgi:hypothetical protein